MLLAVAGSAAGAPSAGVDVTLAAAGPVAVPQGKPFAFKATVASSTAMTGEVVFDLQAPGGARVAFLQKLLVVPPGLPAEVDGSVAASQWYPALGTYTVGASIGGKAVGNRLTFRVTAPTVAVPRFANVTSALGLSTALPDTTCGRWSNGAAWGDVDGDRKLDLFVTRQAQPAQLFVRRGARFVEEAAARGVAGIGHVALGASFADYDNDGDDDLFVTGDGGSRLYRNDGKGSFADVTAEAGVAGGKYMGMSGSWVDYDDDGWLDLYVANHSACAPTDINRGAVVYHPDHLFHSNRNGTFTDVTPLLEKDPSTPADGTTIGATFLGAWFDYDNDGRPDLLLANDFLGQRPDPNRLFHNDGAAGGSWQFTDVSVAAGIQWSMNSMGVAIGDFNRDLRLDFAISNWGETKVERNNGNGTFTDVAVAVGADRPFQRESRPAVTWGLEFHDLNLDGWEDLYVNAGYLVGYLTSTDTPQTNAVFVNDRAGKFLDLSAATGADDAGQSRGVASADYDRDGRVDLFVVNQGGSPQLFRNVTPKGKQHWLEVDPVGTRSNRDGCGTRIVASAKGMGSILRELHCGSTSVSSGSDRVAHFGLGPLAKGVKVNLAVTWPSGLRQVYRNVKVDRLLTLTEPKV